MKKLSILLLLVGFLLVGCQEDNSILESNLGESFEPLHKGPYLSFEDFKRDRDEARTAPKYIKVKKKLARTYTFNGDKGGKIIQKYTWYTVFDTLKLEAYLTIPKGAFKGELTFEIVFDPDELSMELHPTPFQFDIPVSLDLKYKGIGEQFVIDSNNLDFQYYNPNGTFEHINYKDITWDPDERELKVFGAELHHFSRYGWTRRK